MSDKKHTRPIDYTSRDFDSIKDDLVEYAKRYYPDTFKDFSNSSFGSVMFDAVAYIGDILSFYLDYQVNESFLHTSTEYDNLIKIGNQMGYTLEANSSSYGAASFYLTVPANTLGSAPELSHLPTLRRGTRLSSQSGISFYLNSNVDFKNNNNVIKVATVNETTGLPSRYSVKAMGEVVSGNLETETVTISGFKKFRKIKLNTKSITEIISVTDSSGNEYYQVDSLSQDLVYKGVKNSNTSDISQGALEILKPIHAARRFVVERDKESVYVKFGSSSEIKIQKDNLADPSSVILKTEGKDYITDKTFDPNNLIESDKFGISPSNTTLTIVTRVNRTEDSNIAAGQLKNIHFPKLTWENQSLVSTSEKRTISDSIEVYNDSPFLGASSLPSQDELKERIASVYYSQNRAVTSQDYQALIYNMPKKFGAVKRTRVMKDINSVSNNINIYIISELSGKLVQTNSSIKKNLRTWISSNKMINDTIDIVDAKVVNFAVNFKLKNDQRYLPEQVEAQAESQLRKYFSDKMEIGQNISLSDIYSELRSIDGLLDISDLTLLPKTGAGYSSTTFDFDKYLIDNGRTLEVPKNVIMEVKNLFTDINGVSE